MRIRQLRPHDYDFVIDRVDDWWGGRSVQHALPRLFLDHFATTSFAQEQDGAVVGFLVGFFSPAQPETAYIHFIGVDPDHRGAGIASGLYARFFDAALADGRTEVRCITSPVNAASIAFHTQLGFDLVPGDTLVEGTSVHSDYDGPGRDRVCFRKRLTAPVAPASPPATNTLGRL